MSQRIVDELNPQLVLTRNEVAKLLDFGEETDIVDDTVSLNKYNDDILQGLNAILSNISNDFNLPKII